VSASSFIASLVGSLAWPAVIIAILVIFHRQFGTMLERLARVRLGAGAAGSEADLDWNHTESVIRQSLAAARPGGPAGSGAAAGGAGSGRGAGSGGRGSGSPGPGAPGGSSAPGSGGAGVARSPQALVEDRWHALADELRGVVRPSGSVSAEQLASADFDQLMEAALRAGLLDAATVRSLDGLRHLRNLALTSPGLAPRQAQEFAVMADAVSYSMRRESGSVWPVS
jgi:hypothetical protein